MIDIKVNLTILVPGATMLSEQECSKNPKALYDNHRIILRGKKTEVIDFKTRRCRPAKRVMNLSREAYESMIDSKECPSWVKPKIWAKLSKKERLEMHLKRISDNFNGYSYSYQVLDD